MKIYTYWQLRKLKKYRKKEEIKNAVKKERKMKKKEQKLN